MDDPQASQPAAKATLTWPRWIPIILAVVIVGYEWARLLPHARNDFVNHYEMGRRILHGIDIYKGDLNFVYPPFWALIHAPFTIVSDHAAMLILFPFGMAAIVGLVAILKKLADRHWPASGDALFWGTTAAVFLAGPFLDRDLGELGVNTFLVMLCWLGVYLWIDGRDVLGGLSIGLAAAMKCTPVLFIVYFIWKRQWKIAIVALVATSLLSLSPIVLMGPAEFGRATRHWVDGVRRGISDPDPSRGVLGEEKLGNLSLRPALARYLMQLPYGHMGRPETSDVLGQPNGPEDPLFVQFFNLSPLAAGMIVRIIMIAGALVVAWIFRNRVSDRNDVGILWECAILSLAILIYSPVTWRQHCVGVLPAIYFMVRARVTGMRLPKLAMIALVAFLLLVCMPQKEVIGTHAQKLLDSYHTKTAAIVLLMIATIACRRIDSDAAIKAPADSTALA